MSPDKIKKLFSLYLLELGVRAIFMFSFVSFCARKIHRLL
nr:MAG TPA: hypothetical protein [Caudoviricetes sp.]